ncbi:hypothetical protein LPJ64_002655 [Coemansia asiatica]|uniref:Uncharacterized protein n=1 Tax=Coemansia asiatica TaxID=1052880 RepID=A0A9W8CIX2_9FUNG|nr:hypothetical protein LPJ64_002655 [Coemansia asiatica]
MTPFYGSIANSLDRYIKVEDAEEEVCELYAVYYSSDTSDRLNLVDPSKTELEIEIKQGQRHISLIIGQNPNINGELGQTGAVLWNSSVVMSEFFASNFADNWPIDGINVLELGSGCGLVGLTLHQLGAKRIVLTDQARMMRLLNKNIDKNKLPYNKRREQEIFAAEYIWGDDPEDQRILREPVDIVVASDCVYHESVAPLLVRSLVHVCKSSGREGGAPVVAVIGQELRSDLVHQEFLAQLLQHFTVRRVPISDDIDGVYVLYVAWLNQSVSK